MARLVQANMVSPSWDAVGPDHGIVTDSIVSFIVRKGNPKHIATWADLVAPGVKVVTPNPFSSGSARWNLMAGYGAELKLGKSPAEAQDYLMALLKNTVSQPASASDALSEFNAGTGDVLLDYEDDAIAAVKKGDAVQYIVPPQTILIENPIAVVKNASSDAAATSFVNFLLSPAGQKIWAEEGYRPVIASAATAALGGARRAIPVPALRGPAAADGACPGSRRRAPRPPSRRTVRRARRASPKGAMGVASPPPRRGPHHHCPRHS